MPDAFSESAGANIPQQRHDRAPALTIAFFTFNHLDLLHLRTAGLLESSQICHRKPTSTRRAGSRASSLSFARHVRRHFVMVPLDTDVKSTLGLGDNAFVRMVS